MEEKLLLVFLTFVFICRATNVSFPEGAATIRMPVNGKVRINDGQKS